MTGHRPITSALTWASACGQALRAARFRLPGLGYRVQGLETTGYIGYWTVVSDRRGAATRTEDSLGMVPKTTYCLNLLNLLRALFGFRMQGVAICACNCQRSFEGFLFRFHVPWPQRGVLTCFTCFSSPHAGTWALRVN